MSKDTRTSQARSGRRKWHPAALALTVSSAAIAFGATVWTGAGSQTAEATTVAENATAVRVAAPLVQTITEWDEYTGRFEAIDNVEIRARVSGYLTEIAFEDGQIVDKGDLLFRIDPRPFEAELAAARADLSNAYAILDNARRENARGARLANLQALSVEEADRRTRALKEAEAGWAATKARVDRAILDLEFTEVRSPITGRISDDFVSEGNLIVGGAQGGTLLTTVVSQDPIYFEFTASEADYLKYTRLNASGKRDSSRDTANPVQLKLSDENDFVHSGVMSFVDNRLDRSTATMRGRATFSNEDGVFAPGMFGRLRLIGSGEYEAVLVPDASIQTDQSEKFVWVADANNAAERKTVTLGPIVDGLRVVRSGLSSTDRLIVEGTQFIAAGSSLALEPADPIQFAVTSTSSQTH